jgi:hypothetical protein
MMPREEGKDVRQGRTRIWFVCLLTNATDDGGGAGPSQVSVRGPRLDLACVRSDPSSVCFRIFLGPWWFT